MKIEIERQPESSSSAAYEVADIFRKYWSYYCERHSVSRHVEKVAHSIMNCRTSKLGYHKIECDNSDCDYVEISHNSCRDRHCPKCQGSKQLEWVNARLEELLPVPYYHSVFTMPHSLNNLALFNEKLIYDIFFKATSYTLNMFAKDPTYLGGKLGFTGILHTWGQKQDYHVHIHYIVGGCGIMSDGRTVKRLPYREKFLFPAEAMSKMVRCQFVKLLKAAYYNGELNLPGELNRYRAIEEFESFCRTIGNEAWYCYCKPPFSRAEKVVEYLSRYSNRVAISNRRIQSLDNNEVKFSYRDYKDDGKIKSLTLPVFTFLQRFLYHILTFGFTKIRYYGYLSGCDRDKNLAFLRNYFSRLEQKAQELSAEVKCWQDRFSSFFERLCPRCRHGHLQFELVCQYNNSS
ncbi:MAG: IS91 family transposase [bacterium]